MISRTNYDTERDMPCPFIPAVEYRGLSTDTKPIEPPNGSSYFEIDTGNIYFYDQTSDTWRAL